jgi:hypothetical protein
MKYLTLVPKRKTQCRLDFVHQGRLMTFWNKDMEKKFFTEAMKNFASPEQLFYKLTDGYFAYVPKGKGAEGQTLQSRNSLIGQYTEKWIKIFFQPIAENIGLYTVNSVV